LSDRGTVVLEAALAGALSALERASSERGRAEAGCLPPGDRINFFSTVT
jgi:hypothetical protein